MKRHENLLRVKKTKFFTQSQASILTNLTRRQIILLEQANIVAPRTSPILYEWKEIILLKVISIFRSNFTFQSIEGAIKNTEYSADTLCASVSSSFSATIVDSHQGTTFHLQSPCQDSNPLHGIVTTQTDEGATMFIKPQVVVIIPKVIDSLEKTAIAAGIKNFKLKTKSTFSEFAAAS